MKSSKLKIGLVVAASIFIILVGAVFYFISKIDTNEIRQIAKTEIENKFPNSQVEIGEIQLGIGTSIEFKVNSFKLKAKKNFKRDLFDVSDVRVYIPLWSILMGGGTAEIIIKSPKINFEETKKENNWSYTLATSSSGQKSVQTSQKEDSKPSVNTQSKEQRPGKKNSGPEIPTFLAAVKLNLKLVDMEVKYFLKDGQTGKVNLSKIIVGNLGAFSNAAFEISSLVSLNTNGQTLTTDLLIIGEVNSSELIQKKPLKSTVVIKVNNTKLTPSEFNIPNLVSQVSVVMDLNTQKITADIDTTIGQKNSSKQKIIFEDGNLDIKELIVNLYLSEIMSYTGLNISEISLGKSELSLNGNLKVQGKNITPNINGKIFPELLISSNGVDAKFSSNFALKPKLVSLNNTIKVLDGAINVDVLNKIDIAKLDPQNLPLTTVNVTGTNLNIGQEFIQKTLYKKNGNKETKQDSTNNNPQISDENNIEDKKIKKSKVPVPFLPPAKVSILFDKVKIGNEDFKFQGNIEIEKNIVKTDKMKFSFSEGKGVIQNTTTLGQNNELKDNFNLNLKNLNLDSLKAFLPSVINEVTGVASGDVNGSVELSTDSFKHDVDVNVDVLNGELKSMNIGEYIKKLQKVKFIKDKLKDIENLKGDFDKLNLMGNFKHDDYHIKSMNFHAKNDDLIFKGDGHVYPLGDKEGQLKGEFIINIKKIADSLKKDIGTNKLPVKLVGKGFGLSLDYTYTLEMLAKSAAKTQGKKLIDKNKDKIKDKLKEKLKSIDTKKLLKGLF